MRTQSAFVICANFFLLIVALFPINADCADMPTLDEIAQANSATWAAIETVDMEFAIISEVFVEGEVLLMASVQNRWILSPDKERLVRVYDLGEGDSLLSDCLLDENALREHQATTDAQGVLFCGTISPTINPMWQNKVNLSPYLLRYPCGEIDLDTTKTLAWVIENWPTQLNGSHQHNGDTIWRLHVQCPAESPWCDGKMQIEVNANKGFLVQNVTVNSLALGLTDEEGRTMIEMRIAEFVRSEDGEHYFPSGFVSQQFAEPVGEEHSPHTVYKEIPTRLSVNGKLPENCLDFKFEKHEIVTEYDLHSEVTAVYLWGDDNRPMQTFASYAELDRWQLRQDVMAFVSDCCNLPHIIGRDLGHIANYAMTVRHQRLLAEQQRKENLQKLAPLPIDKSDAEQSAAVISGELLADEKPGPSPIQSPQISETPETTLVSEVLPP